MDPAFLDTKNQFFELSVDLLCIAGEDGYFKILNPAWEKVLGYTREELLERPFLHFVHEEDRESTIAETASLASGNETVDFANRYRCKDGSYRWLGWTAHPQGDGTIYAVARDITESKELEKRLLENQRLFVAMADSTPVLVWMSDSENRCTYFNKRWVDFTGITFDESLGDGWSRAVHPEDRDECLEIQRRNFLAREPFTIEYRLRRHDGEYRWVLDSGAPRFDSDGSFVGFIGNRMDVTDRKLAEEERMQRRMRFTQKLESIGVLAGGIAHDFNNLLVGVLGNAELAQAMLTDKAPARRYVDRIQTAARRAAGLCKQLLAYAGKGRVEARVFSLGELVGDIASLIEVSIPKSIRLVTNVASETRPIEADVDQVRQVVMNLVTNAAEAIGSDHGEVTLTVGDVCLNEIDAVRFGAPGELPAGEYAYVQVSDTGSGMDEATLENIFQPFFTTKATGRGLGLAALQGIVRAHGGAIHVQSELGEGTSMRVLLPTTEKPAESLDRAAREEPTSGAGHVLVVDDEELVRGVASDMLSLHGYGVTTAADGLEALELYAADPQGFDIVLVDLTMPEMGGAETIARLRGIRSDVRIVLSSGQSEEAAAVESSFDAFVEKPYTSARLLSTIAQVLRSR